MMLPIRALLAWQNLLHDRRRFLASVAGVAFAVLLMFMELGFWNAMLDSMVELIGTFNAELVVTNRTKYSLTLTEPFARRRLLQARAVPEVYDTYPLYMEYGRGLWKDPDATDPNEPSGRPIRVLAFDPDKPVLRLPGVGESAAQLRLPDTVLVDTQSRRFFGRLEAGTTRELAQHAVHVVGTFHLGTDFTANGTVILSEENYARLFPSWQSPDATLGLVEIGLIKLRPGADPVAVKGALRQTLPDDVAVFTREEFAEQEKEFWRSSTPIGFVFLVGLVMGFVVGVVICYQVLSADVARHLPEFATLKAIGFRNRALTVVVLEEAVLLSILGFLPGLALSGLLYRVLAYVTGLPMHLTLLRATLVLVMAMAMCLLSGLFAIRKVQKTDPAEVF
jgi:putative ABC transport system permease protein